MEAEQGRRESRRMTILKWEIGGGVYYEKLLFLVAGGISPGAGVCCVVN